MKTVSLSVGGKTFIAGEYLALTGGPALILATDPRFELLVKKSSGAAENIFHPQSLAGKFWNLHSELFQNYQLQFKDPYQIGGFGASSAQFALLHSLWQLQDKIFFEAERFFDWHLMLQDYRELGGQESGFSPSGADVVCACAGGLTWFDRSNGKVQTFAWPFLEIDFHLVHTGNKLATHEHLKILEAFDTEGYKTAMADIHSGLSLIQFEQFLLGLKAYRSALESQHRVTEFTAQKVKKIESHPAVLFAKGCGAMGSDVILVLCEKSQSSVVRALTEKEGLKWIAGSEQISRGLYIQNLDNPQKELSI